MARVWPEDYGSQTIPQVIKKYSTEACFRYCWLLKTFYRVQLSSIDPKKYCFCAPWSPKRHRIFRLRTYCTYVSYLKANINKLISKPHRLIEVLFSTISKTYFIIR